MKSLRYGPIGQERPGLLDSSGRIRSPWPAVSDLTPEVISAEGLKVFAALDLEKTATRGRQGAVRRAFGRNSPGLRTRPPNGSKASDREIELAVVIAAEIACVSEANALAHAASCCLANDLSERDWQGTRCVPFVKGKSVPTFGPLGPYMVTIDEIPDPQRIDLRLDVSGAKRQDGKAANLVFSVKQIVAHVSDVKPQRNTLE